MTDEGEAQWIDISVINTATPTYATIETTFITAQQQRRCPPSDDIANVFSPALVAGEIKKNEKYSRLMMIANRASAGKRSDRPKGPRKSMDQLEILRHHPTCLSMDPKKECHHAVMWAAPLSLYHQSNGCVRVV